MTLVSWRTDFWIIICHDNTVLYQQTVRSSSTIHDGIEFDLMLTSSRIDLASSNWTRCESLFSRAFGRVNPFPRWLPPKYAYIRRTRAIWSRDRWARRARGASSKGLSALVVGEIDLIGIVWHSVASDAIVAGWSRSPADLASHNLLVIHWMRHRPSICRHRWKVIGRAR